MDRRILESQLRHQRSVVKNAVAASLRIEGLIRGEVQVSVNWEVANEALSLAEKQLNKYDKRGPAQVYPQTVYTAPDYPSRPPSPVSIPRPPAAPLFPGNPSSPAQPHVSTRDAGLRKSTVSSDTTPSRVSVPNGPDQPRSVGAQRRHHGVPPTPGDVTIDVGHRTARTVTLRRERGNRFRDANRNVVRREHHLRDYEGQRGRAALNVEGRTSEQ